MIMSKLKHLIRGLSCPADKYQYIESGKCSTQANTSHSTPGQYFENFEKIFTIRYVTTYQKAKRILTSRRLISRNPDEYEEQNILLGQFPVVKFEPVTTMVEQSSEGNVTFGFRTLNGAHGIWDCNVKDDKNKVWNAEGQLVSPDKDLKYYRIQTSETSTVILLTRRDIFGMELYDPSCPSTMGPWKTSMNPVTGVYDHFIAKNMEGFSFALDDTVFDANSQHRLFFLEGIFVSYNQQLKDTSPSPSVLLDNHVTTGPLRLFLAASCFRWLGGVHCVTSGEFEPERAIKRYEAYHARMSREVLINTKETSEQIKIQPKSVEVIEQWLQNFRLLKYILAKEACPSIPSVQQSIRYYFSDICVEMKHTEDPGPLRSALQVFVLFLASNCLDEDPKKTGDKLCDFDEMYKFVLSFLPSEAHQVFRDCIVNRIIRAIDEVY